MAVTIKTFFDKATFSLTHIVADPATGCAAIIDPVLNYDAETKAISHQSAQDLLDEIALKNYSLKWILETHVHADHLSAAHWLKQQTGALVAISSGVQAVQKNFNREFELTGDNVAIAEDFDKLIENEEVLKLGELTIKAIHTPGHTPSCCTYLVENCAFVGDSLFMPDYGTARCDFPGGNAKQLYQSIQRVFELGDETQLFMCHDYMPNGRELKWQCSVKEQKASNIHVNETIDEASYILMRTERDKSLSVPKLIKPALRVNIRAGKLPTQSN